MMNGTEQTRIGQEPQRQLYHSADCREKTFIPAKPKLDIYESGRTFRVCAYCRVSTDNDEQLSSFELQQSHYRQLMGNHPNWDLVHIYADEGISGTSLKKRDDFNRMIAACEAGEYDLIVTKSVSRFARNLVDCVSLARKLKNQKPPIGIFFETDNFNTLSEGSELMLSFLATFAQEESVKKSESMNWSLQQRFKDGKLLTPAPLGYRKPKDASGHYIKYAPLEIVKSEAEVVRFIFNAFLAGYTTKEIADLLNDIGCPTKTGRKLWCDGSINYILQNERYCGSVLTWKTFTSDMYEHKHRKNRQDRDQYLYTDTHEAIVTIEIFESVQVLLENRKHHVRGQLPTMQVIGGGVFRGYIPINHHWVNENPAGYYEASNSVCSKLETRNVKRNLFSAFDLDGYQVVRSQFMATRAECPCVSITLTQIVFNIHCVRKFGAVPYIQLLLHPSERKLAIRPCRSSDVHSIRWRPELDKPVFSKAIHCQYFSSALFQIMNWNPDFLYRIRGVWATRGNEQIIVFNLENAVPYVSIEQESRKQNQSYKSKIPLCPEEWSDSFGENFYDHRLQYGFYFLATDWNAQVDSDPVQGVDKRAAISDEKLKESLENLKMKAGSLNGT